VRYTVIEGVKLGWEVEFENNYNQDLYFSYVLAEKWKTPSSSNAEVIKSLKSYDTKTGFKTWYTAEPDRLKVEDMKVTLFRVAKGYTNWQNSEYAKCDEDETETNTSTTEKIKPANTFIQVLDTVTNALNKIIEAQKARNNQQMDQIKQQNNTTNTKNCQYGKCPKCGQCLEQGYKGGKPFCCCSANPPCQ